MRDCIFCKISKGEIPSYTIYEDDKVIVFLDIVPINKGHALVVPKKHFETILDCEDSVLKEIIVVAKKVTPAILKAVNSEGFNIGINNKRVAGQLVPHLHLHIMPRFEEDGHRLFGGKEAEKDELKKTADKIKSLLK